MVRHEPFSAEVRNVGVERLADDHSTPKLRRGDRGYKAPRRS
jgi:hypothetical protein